MKNFSVAVLKPIKNFILKIFQGYKIIMKCHNDHTKTYNGKEHTPLGLGKAASGETIGTEMLGKDGNTYIVKKYGNGKRWIRKNISAKGSPRGFFSNKKPEWNLMDQYAGPPDDVVPYMGMGFDSPYYPSRIEIDKSLQNITNSHGAMKKGSIRESLVIHLDPGIATGGSFPDTQKSLIYVSQLDPSLAEELLTVYSYGGGVWSSFEKMFNQELRNLLYKMGEKDLRKFDYETEYGLMNMVGWKTFELEEQHLKDE